MELTGSGILRLKNTTGDRIRLWTGSTPGFNIGVESGAMYQTIDANCKYYWYCGAVADGGTSAEMSLYPAHLRLSQTSEFDLDFLCKSGATDRKFSRVTAQPGKIALELLNDAYNSAVSGFGLTPTYTISSVASISTLPSTASLDANLANGQFYVYAPNNTQLIFRMRSGDGVVRQGTMTMA